MVAGPLHRSPIADVGLLIALVLGVSLAVAAAALQPDTAAAQASATGVECNASGGSGGLAPGEHNVTIAGRPALVYVGSGYDADRPAILSYYLHGDGAGDRPFMSTERRALLDNNGWIYVAPLANGNRWWAGGVSSIASDNESIEQNAQLLEDVFDSLFADYNVCRNVLLGSSASGGSWFYDAYFFPTRGAQYPAYMNLGCGSSGITTEWQSFPFYDDLLNFNTNQEVLARIKLHYSIGDGDFLFANAERSAPFLKSLGFDVTTDIRPGVLHCAFDVDVTAVEWWADLCENGFIPVSSFDASGAVRPESCSREGQAAAGPTCEGRVITIDMNANGGNGAGTAQDDVILGTPGDDVINSLAGNDTICSGGGDDTVNAGAGDDVVRAGSGDDRIDGGAGVDRLFGVAGDDTISGGDGDDTIHGNLGNDTLRGDAGDDRIFGYADDDTIFGGDGNDRLHGNFGEDVIWGEAGDDIIIGYGDADTLHGGPGNDKMHGNFGEDEMNGNAGNDTLFGYGDDDIINGGLGDDIINGNRGNDTLNGNEDDDQVKGADGQDIVDGGPGNDTLFGNALNDIVNGGPGQDVLDGGPGIDSCFGGIGTDASVRCEPNDQ